MDEDALKEGSGSGSSSDDDEDGGLVPEAEPGKARVLPSVCLFRQGVHVLF